MLQEKTRVWTVRDLMKFSIDHLQRRGFDEARLNVELLLSHALKCQRIQLYTNFDKPLTPEELKVFRSFYERRLNREPVQYIIGSTSFMGLQFQVDTRVLIPRPETETLVEQAMFVCQRISPSQAISIIEVGTGSGNIAVALAKFVKNAVVTSIETSLEALEVARLNAEFHNVQDKITFEHIDVFEPVDQLLLKRFDILVSNPPYASKDDWEQLQQEVRKFEPRVAVSDWKDGYEFYRRLIELAPYLLRDGGMMLLEIGFGQSEKIISVMQQAGFFDCSVVPDLQAIPRVVIASCHATTRNKGFAN
ncbi:MAG: peptide chain release factor N(5)-glutamine methyltransferase [Ignavibacteriales bacterium]|nr:peptide chain release factor N(5)-glutamine methyltransferase [Ignavibacteriales bacterium]